MSSRLPYVVLTFSFVVFPLAVLAVTKKRAEDPNAGPSSKAPVWVKISDGGIQCEPDKAVSLEVSAEALTKAGVKILEKKKTRDGKMRPQMCGMPAGTENSFLVSPQDLQKATAAGFRE